jgi:septal ring factor EnvC (AmiA/AmiB activator)
MRIFLLFLILSTFGLASTSQKITSSQQNLKSTIFQEKELGRKLDDIAQTISKEKDELSKIDSQIKTLQKQISILQEETKETTIALKELKEKNASLEKTKQELETRMIRIIADQF